MEWLMGCLGYVYTFNMGTLTRLSSPFLLAKFLIAQRGHLNGLSSFFNWLFCTMT